MAAIIRCVFTINGLRIHFNNMLIQYFRILFQLQFPLLELENKCKGTMASRSSDDGDDDGG